MSLPPRLIGVARVRLVAAFGVPPVMPPATTAPAPTAPAFFSTSRRSSSPPAGLSGVRSSDIVPAPPPVPEVVRGSDRPLVPRPEYRHKRRTHGPESWK